MGSQMLVALCVALLGCGACSRDLPVIEDVASPDKRHRALVYTSKAGGVASDLHTSISIVNGPSEGLGWPPNTFTATHGSEVTPAGAYFGPLLAVRWRGSDTLEIVHDHRVSILRQKTEVGDVRVIYTAVTLPDSARGRPGA